MVASLFVVLEIYREDSLSTLFVAYWIPFSEPVFVLQSSIAPFYMVILMGSFFFSFKRSANTSARCSGPDRLIFSIEMEVEVGHD